MTHSTSLTRVCLFLSVFAAACGSSSKGNLQGSGATGGADASAGGSPAASGGTTGEGGSFSGGGDTSSGGANVSAGGTTSAEAGVAGGSDDGGTRSPDGSAPQASCRTNSDCATVPGKLLCEAATGKCIACHTNAQCADDEECTNTVCTKLPKCSSSLDCASASGGKSICDKPNGVCVQCTADADCGANKVCSGRVCGDSCSSDNDCTAKHMLCNQGIGFNSRCTQCVVDSDCKSGQYCESGGCVPQTCHPSQQSCDGDLVVECNEAGSGVTPLTQCTLVLLSSCVVTGDNAKCVGACENRKQDGLETDIDCGGPACPRCGDNKGCVLGTDCSSNKCTASKCD